MVSAPYERKNEKTIKVAVRAVKPLSRNQYCRLTDGFRVHGHNINIGKIRIIQQTREARSARQLLYKYKKTFKNEQRNRDDTAKKRVNTSGVGESINYYEDIYNIIIYLLTTTLTNHTHRFHPLATPTSC